MPTSQGNFQHNKETFQDTTVTTNMMSRDDLSETSDDKQLNITQGLGVNDMVDVMDIF